VAERPSRTTGVTISLATGGGAASAKARPPAQARVDRAPSSYNIESTEGKEIAKEVWCKFDE
jgi:hypothetical protein